MKKIINGFLLVCLVGCANNHSAPHQKVVISLVCDTTDRNDIVIKSNPILRLYKLDQTPDNEALFRFRVITNVKLTPVTIYHLPPASNYNGNEDPQAHNRAIVDFYSMVRQTIDTFQSLANQLKSLKNSECFYTIAEELKFLSNSSFDRKILIVFSDLFEKSELADVYKGGLSSDQLYNSFQKKFHLKNLNNIKIFFVYDPKDNKEYDTRYEIITLVYKKLFESRGATVSIQADANNFY